MKHCPAAYGQCWATWHQGALGDSRCVWWEELVGLDCWLHFSMLGLGAKNPSLCLGPLCLSSSLGRAGKGADLDRQPQGCSV